MLKREMRKNGEDDAVMNENEGEDNGLKKKIKKKN